MPLIVPRRTLEELAKFDNPEDFRKEVFKRINVNDVEVLLNRVLVAVYIEHERTKGGILKPVETLAESIWQGKAAVVVKVGPAAFQDDSRQSFYGQKLEPGDFCTFKISNSSQIELYSVPCRIVMDYHIEAKYRDPRAVTS